MKSVPDINEPPTNKNKKKIHIETTIEVIKIHKKTKKNGSVTGR